MPDKTVVSATDPRLELMVRVKLPEGGSYEGFYPDSSEDEHIKTRETWTTAIFAAKPPGYEVKWPKRGQTWPMDSEGYTWVPLYLTYAKDAIHHWMDEYYRTKDALDRLRQGVKDLGVR